MPAVQEAGSRRQSRIWIAVILTALRAGKDARGPGGGTPLTRQGLDRGHPDRTRSGQGCPRSREGLGGVERAGMPAPMMLALRNGTRPSMRTRASQTFLRFCFSGGTSSWVLQDSRQKNRPPASILPAGG